MDVNNVNHILIGLSVHLTRPGRICSALDFFKNEITYMIFYLNNYHLKTKK